MAIAWLIPRSTTVINVYYTSLHLKGLEKKEEVWDAVHEVFLSLWLNSRKLSHYVYPIYLSAYRRKKQDR